MIERYRKLLLVVLALSVLLCMGAVIYFILPKNHPASTKSSSSQSSTSPQSSQYSVTTTNLDKIPAQLSDKTLTLIKQSVDQTVTSRHGKGTYTATYRTGSFQQITYPSGGVAIQLLIDVPETKETYLFTKTGTEYASASTSEIRCAPANEQMVHPSVCQDPGEGY